MRNRRLIVAAQRRDRPAPALTRRAHKTVAARLQADRRADRRSFATLLANMPDVGTDADFARVDLLEVAGRELAYEVFAEGDLWVARCPSPEVASDGPTRAAAVAGLREALELRLA